MRLDVARSQEGTAFMNSQSAAASPQFEFIKPLWTALLGPPWFVSLVFFAIIAAVRFFAVFSPYSLQELFFLQTVAMWAAPFFLLTASGRRDIGLSQLGITPRSIFLSVLAGSVCGLVLFGLGMIFYGDSPNNWCVSIHNYLHLDEMRGLLPPVGLFALYTLPAIFMNPVGEEILFRGIVQQAFARRFNPAFATIVNSLLFALIYLCLHGVWRDASGFHIRIVSASIAVFLLACTGGVYTLCRMLSGSLWPAMAAHAAFNLTVLALTIHQFLH
jgi:membrane protease YdiL (CAAX protease family)